MLQDQDRDLTSSAKTNTNSTPRPQNFGLETRVLQHWTLSTLQLTSGERQIPNHHSVLNKVIVVPTSPNFAGRVSCPF